MVKYEELEHNLVKLTVEIPFEDVNKAEDGVYQKMKGRINVPGFRKGKAPRSMIEHLYGRGVFLEDAVNDIVPDAYEKAVEEVEKEHGITITSYPEIEYTQVELDKPVIFEAKAAKKPEVKLGKYKGLKVEAPSAEVTDEDIQKALEEEQAKNSSIVPVEGRPVADGDIITLDFLGKVDDVAFPGGEGKDYELTIGSHTFIPGFEEQLVGMNAEETKDITVTFPEDYGEKSLAGKEAVFTCTVHSIKVKELPELNDEFASEVSDFDTLEEYKQDVAKKLGEKKAADAKRAKEDALLEAVVAKSEIDLPDMMITSEARMSVQNFAQRLQSQGLSMEQYMKYTGATEAQLIEEQKAPAEKQIRGRLVLEAIAAAENIEVTDADVDAEFAKMAEQYGIEADKLRSFSDESQIEAMKKDLATGKALDLIYEQSK